MKTSRVRPSPHRPPHRLTAARTIAVLSVATLIAVGGSGTALAQPDAASPTAPETSSAPATPELNPCALPSPTSTTTTPNSTTPTTEPQSSCPDPSSTESITPPATQSTTTESSRAPEVQDAPAPQPLDKQQVPEDGIDPNAVAPPPQELAPLPDPVYEEAPAPVPTGAESETSTKTAEPDPDYSPTENPHATIVPGQMRSDREEIPAGATKEMADLAETMEAKKMLSRAAPGCQNYWPFPYDVCGAIKDKYNALGGPGSFLSYPNSPEYTNPDGFGKRTQFLNGPIYWSAATGAHPVVNSFLNRWGLNNYEAGRLKYPTTDEIVLPDGGRRQEFQQGVIYVAIQNAVGSAILNGPLRDKYNTVGGLAPGGTLLGYPIQDQIAPLPDGQGQMARFQNGVIYWSPSTGAHWVTGRLLSLWAQAGYEQSQYRYPTSDTVPRQNEPGSSEQQFQFGSMYSAADQYFVGIQNPVAGPVGPPILPTFNSYDTGLHPNYTTSGDLANALSVYNSVPDPLNQQKPANQQAASVISNFFGTTGRPNAQHLFDHYYGNGGAAYAVDSSYLDVCLRAATQDYPPDTPPVTPPAPYNTANRNDAIARAVAEADRTGAYAKVIVNAAPGAPWVSPIGAADQDCVLGIGRFSISPTTAVIAAPGAAGAHAVQLRQTTHLQDVYDYSYGTQEYPALNQAAVNTAYTGALLGIAKPFEVYGNTSEYTWQGAA